MSGSPFLRTFYVIAFFAGAAASAFFLPSMVCSAQERPRPDDLASEILGLEERVTGNGDTDAYTEIIDKIINTIMFQVDVTCVVHLT